MKIIQELADRMSEEIEDAERYAKDAIAWKDNNKSLADTFYKLSLDEMSHMSALHGEITKIIEDYRKTNGEPPKPMMAVYEYLHGKQIDKAAIVKALQSSYKGG